MKKTVKFLKYVFVFIMYMLHVVSCQKETLNPGSVIVDPVLEENDFDRWLYRHYVQPYNIQLLYQYVDIESDLNYRLSPADYQSSIILSQMIKYLIIDPYDELTGSTAFMRRYFPKYINFIGSFAFRNNGTVIVGTAEGGYKITMYNVNGLNTSSLQNINFLNTIYFHTMHHEFAHILHQTIPIPRAFDMISAGEYVTDAWNSIYGSLASSTSNGFITPYASSEVQEDFVELFATYILTPANQWEQRISLGGSFGASIIRAKFEVLYNYMLNFWDIDLNELRDIIQEKQSRLSEQDFETLND